MYNLHVTHVPLPKQEKRVRLSPSKKIIELTNSSNF